MRVAIVHEWLSTIAGSEKVVTALLEMYPDADIFAVVDFLPDAERRIIKGKQATTTFIQKLPLAKKYFRHYLPLMPMAIEQLDLSEYDLVLSSNHAVAKGVRVHPHQVHVSYVHSPLRYAWDLQEAYLKDYPLAIRLLLRPILHYLRLWDTSSAARVDQFVANSGFIARRIEQAYRREAIVVHPPVAIEAFALQAEKQDYYLAASRLVPYKNMPVIAEAFAAMPDKKLVIIGDGPDAPAIRTLAAKHRNIDYRGYQDNAALVTAMQNAKALIFAAVEDFGIVPVEAQACGTPVIALRHGGALDSVRGYGEATTPTGLFFAEPTVAAIKAAVAEFDALPAGAIKPEDCRTNAEHFSGAAFAAKMRTVIDEALVAHRQTYPAARAS